MESRKMEKKLHRDEKCFCLDGPDGFQADLNDLSTIETFISRRQQGAEGAMVWGVFMGTGKQILFLWMEE